MGFHYFKYIIICTIDKLLVLLKSLFGGFSQKKGGSLRLKNLTCNFYLVYMWELFINWIRFGKRKKKEAVYLKTKFS